MTQVKPNPMQQYLDTLRRIHEEGHNHSDRTGNGRRSIYGVQMRFNLQDGFPLDGSRLIYTDAIGKELILLFLAGETNKSVLEEAGVKMWNKWSVGPEHIEKFIDRFQFHRDELPEGNKPTEEEIAAVRKGFSDYYQSLIGSIGPMYGAMWRNAPGDNTPNLELQEAIVKDTLKEFLDEKFNDIPSDKKLKLAKHVIHMHNLQGFDEEPLKVYEEAKYRHFALEDYWKTIDQLGNLIDNLKKRPYSSRHRVTAMVPEFYPYEDYSPQENVLAGKGALTPCHCIWQCHVTPPAEEGGKMRLSMSMYQSSCDFPVGVPYNISQYAMLLTMLAQVVDMEPYEFIWTGGDVHYYINQKPFVEEHLTREAQPLPTLWLNPEVKDLFAFKPEDVRIDNYSPLAPIKYPVAV